MKIDQSATSATPPARPAKAGSAPAAGTDAAGGTKDAAQMSAQVHSLPSAPGGDFDAARVAAIRDDIRAGRYQVHPERIADGLIDSVRDLLGSKKKDA
ncbi:flagellar biosynthesis anti-sigma factor FlgM [Variovorax sp. SRS16]|uniref:flagellar biosynthesis anti-sigma factor FlgM n=1 Tax=Variovorax sp. SRS16 TaxID=282217 RepID=UPI0013163CC2|nr:flagellar biosynthesis anti-sigma factor FlgM [Variovorax sp. SRS16]VTU25564.1 flagellar biosynthesis anti-sigma factor FlgM [Variovorax sp. SRS16]